ncbi:MAG: Gfo/Idh/MocA family oxidoreductase, partial [Candidatus Peregrinibacteria bacterium]|nr:Gfo/Idh/MocA family oxidoreductase [Candidatus Peregrinibacteria bacterium]
MIKAHFDYKILICGTGSIGKRHTRNLRTLGIQHLAVFDPNEQQRKEIAAEIDCDDCGDYEEALSTMKPDIVFVCSPTKYHVTQAMAAAKAGAHLFIEKPLNHTMDGISELQKEVQNRNLTCMVGCNMRFHHGPSTVKRLLNEGVIGAPKRSEIAVAFNFTGRPDFENKVENYSKSYNADPEQGGATRECVHEIDLALWYFGSGVLSSAEIEMASRIQLPDVDGTADLVLQHENGAVSNVHLSFMDPEYKRYCKIEGAEGSIAWSISDNVVKVYDAAQNEVASYPQPDGYEFAVAYIAQTVHFLDCVAHVTKPMASLDDAIRALKIALDALENAK